MLGLGLGGSEMFIRVRVNVARLRKKLEGIGVVDMIKTRKGIGYAVD